MLEMRTQMQIRYVTQLATALSLICALPCQMATAQSVAVAGPATQASAAAPLRLSGRTELPGYTGDFDHFEVDVKGNRLFLAAEDHATLEVFDLKSAKLTTTIEGFEVPHGLLFLPESNRLLVTDSGAGLSKFVDMAANKVTGTFGAVGADSMAYDASRKHLYVVTGGRDAKMKESSVSEYDPQTGKLLGEVKFDTDKVEGMAIEQKGNRMFVNVTGKNTLVTIDKDKRTVIASWPVKEAEQNAPLAMDETTHRLFVVTRKPGMLIIKNADTGASIASFKAPERTDQVLWDQANKRIYVLGGEGYIGVFQQQDADHYAEVARIPSATGAKTGILVPEHNKLFVAVSPGEGKTGAAVLNFDVTPN
jgi:DNA-binding beta-propeller fold protein YncE